MTGRAVFLVAGLVATLAAADGCVHPRPAAPAPPADRIVLLPDPDDGHLGAASVTSPAGSVELTMARGSTRVAPGAAPTPQTEMTEEEIQRVFGEALAARPPAPRQFLLYFLTGGDELTPESRTLLPQIVELVRGRAAADVTVIGHTDTTDTAQANAALGLRRATLIRNQLLAAGLNESQVDVSSHGETDLLVATADNVAQPRNRRVEVTVR
jgi:outer membrane protein OmpA-like peptidoglycan-associated protein